MRLIFLLFLSFIYDIRSEEINEDIENGHLSTGAILRKQEGYAQSSNNGGTIAFFRSRPRIAAVRTFNEGYVGGDRTPQLRQTIHDGNYDHDLHTAYRLPLQRLSDQQLSMILKKHSPEIRDGNTHMSRVEMINEVQEKIVQKSTKKLMRPTLLTNINVLPEEITIDNEPVENPKTHQRTTVSSIISATEAPEAMVPEVVKALKGKVRRSQKNIPELETEEQHPVGQHFQSERLRKLSTKLRYVKARYDVMKMEYLQRLRQINERKISLAIKTIPVEPSVIAKEFNNEPKKIISTVLIDNDPSNSQEENVSVPVKIIPSKSRRIITTAVKTLIDNEPESIEITTTHVTPLVDNEPVESETEATTQTSTTSRTDWEQSMIDKLRKIVEKAKAQQVRIHQKSETTAVEQHQQQQQNTHAVSSAYGHVSHNVVVPYAHGISRQYASKVVKQERVLPIVGLHDGGNNSGEAEEVTTTQQPQTEEIVVPKGMVDNDSHSGFKFAMKKVGEISTSELLGQLNDELETVEEKTTPSPPPPTTTPTLIATTTVEEEETTAKIIESDDDEEELDLFAESDEEAVCDAISCDFEKGDLCQWEASQDELNPSSPHYHRRHRKAHFIRRTWHNWQGRYRNRVTGIARAQMFSFDNQRFAAAYVRPFQRATLTGKLLSGEKETIRFRAWEATRNVQLKVCCDTTETCVFETEVGVYRGSRRWREHTATCPRGTTQIIFECINHGIYQGACGIDNIHLMNAYCPQVIPISGIHDSERRRKLKYL